MRVQALIVPAFVAASLAACSSQKDTTPEAAKPAAAAPAPVAKEPPLTAEESVLVTATAKVVAIDHAKREVTFKGSGGDEVTCTVDKRVQRLNEVKAGDDVTVGYYVSVAGELRPPTPEEAKAPIQIVEGAARAPKDTEPAAGALRTIRVVTTVEKLNLDAQTVTLKGPRGNSVTIRARYPENLKKIKLGDTIIVTYTEALAVALDKVAPR